MATIHLVGFLRDRATREWVPEERTFCGRLSAQVLTIEQDQAVDEGTCGACWRIDQARQVAAYREEQGHEVLKGALERVPEAGRHVKTTAALEDQWLRFATRMWDRYRDDAPERVAENLRRMVARAERPQDELQRRQLERAAQRLGGAR